jgi:hypothetical protein
MSAIELMDVHAIKSFYPRLFLGIRVVSDIFIDILFN